MRKLLFAITLLASTPASAADITGAFGLHLGQHYFSHRPPAQSGDGAFHYGVKPPIPHQMFSRYIVTVTPENRIWRISAYGDRCTELETVMVTLVLKYGLPVVPPMPVLGEYEWVDRRGRTIRLSCAFKNIAPDKNSLHIQYIDRGLEPKAKEAGSL